MVTHLTCNEKIAGSIPAVGFFCWRSLFLSLKAVEDRIKSKPHRAAGGPIKEPRRARREASKVKINPIVGAFLTNDKSEIFIFSATPQSLTTS